MRAFLAAAAATLVAAQSDTECGNATLPLSPTRKNVMVLGDSISMAVPYTPGGYGVPLQQILGSKGVAVQHAGGWYSGGQCSNTVKGLLCHNASTPHNYLNFTGTFDVVSFNYGLHDLVAACQPGETGECEEHVDPDVYAANLVTIFNHWVPRAKAIIWTSTTPVPNVNTSLGRTYANAVLYNTYALKALTAAAQAANVELTVNDLWSDVIAYCGVLYTSCALQIPANVHFEPAGQQFLAAKTAAVILKVLGVGGSSDVDGAATA